MKRLLVLVTVFFLLLTGMSWSAEYLACDLQPNVVASEVEVDGTVMPGIAVVSGSDLLLLDVSGLSSGPHTFKARLQDTSGWWGAWNASPLDASKPGEATLRIVDK